MHPVEAGSSTCLRFWSTHAYNHLYKDEERCDKAQDSMDECMLQEIINKIQDLLELFDGKFVWPI